MADFLDYEAEEEGGSASSFAQQVGAAPETQSDRDFIVSNDDMSSDEDEMFAHTRLLNQQQEADDERQISPAFRSMQRNVANAASRALRREIGSEAAAPASAEDTEDEEFHAAIGRPVARNKRRRTEDVRAETSSALPKEPAPCIIMGKIIAKPLLQPVRSEIVVVKESDNAKMHHPFLRTFVWQSAAHTDGCRCMRCQRMEEETSAV